MICKVYVSLLQASVFERNVRYLEVVCVPCYHIRMNAIHGPQAMYLTVTNGEANLEGY
jgi:hypothetical protein